MANCAGVVSVFQGICYHGCMCFSIYEALCLAPEQTTYYNGCLFGCSVKGAARVENFIIPGECTGACGNCPLTYNTVCDASTGNEYSNGCFAECSGILDWQEGSCDMVWGLVSEDCGCSGEGGGEYDLDADAYDLDVQVCSFDGVTYDNACVAYCHSKPIAYTGPCETACASCADQGGPEVCGADGVTYMNACAARCAPIDVNPAVEGACSDKSDGCGCSAEVLQPVCGTSGNTYMNRCFAECAADMVEAEGPCEYNSDYFEPKDGYGTPIAVVDGVVVTE